MSNSVDRSVPLIAASAELPRLPYEVLVEILFYSTVNKDQKGTFLFHIYSNRVGIDKKMASTVLCLNKRILGLLGPKLFPNHFHISLPIVSTRYMRSFRSFREYISLTFNKKWFTKEECEMIRELENSVSNYNYITNFINIIKEEFPAALSNFTRDEAPQIYISSGEDFDMGTLYRCFERYMLSIKEENDYEILRFSIQPDSKFRDAWYSIKENHIIENPVSAKKFCTRIMNNNNSILRRFIKTLTVDLLFLDEFQTTKTTRHTLFGSIVEKYKDNDNKFLSITTTPFKALSNYFVTNPFLKRDSIDPARKNRVWSCKGRLRNDLTHYQRRLPNSRNPPPGMNGVHWSRYKEGTLWSCFMQFFARKERFSMMSLLNKSDLKRSLDNLFKDFDILKQYNIKRRIDNRTERCDQLTPEQRLCFLTTSEVFSHTKQNLVDKTQNDIKLDSFFHSSDGLSNIIEEIVKACTTNSPDNMHTSLIAFSLENSNENNNDEGFENFRPKMFVVNKPALNQG